MVAGVAAGWEFDPRELHLLERACRCADELAELEKAVDAEGRPSEAAEVRGLFRMAERNPGTFARLVREGFTPAEAEARRAHEHRERVARNEAQRRRLEVPGWQDGGGS